MADQPPPEADDRAGANAERAELLALIDDWLELPMLLLGAAWLALLVVDLGWGLTPFLDAVSTTIWIVFVVEFVVRFALAPRRLAYLRRSWLTVLSLALPALRVFRLARFLRLLRAARAARGVRLVRVVTGINRGMRTLARTMQRRALGYVLALTAIVTVGGAAGMYAFERDVEGTALADFGSALWWTAMAVTTMGSEYWPQTGEGRILCLLLSIYAFAVFGYITAALASYFVGRDAERDDAELAGRASMEQVRAELAALRLELQAVLARDRPTAADREPPG